MAINTSNKRASAINLGLPWRSTLPAPDGEVGFGDRAFVAFFYGAPPDTSLVPGLFVNSQTLFAPTILGHNQLLPGRVNNAQSFSAPTVRSKNYLLPLSVNNSQSFRATTVSALARLFPGLAIIGKVFFAPTVASKAKLLPVAVFDGDTFFAPSLKNKNFVLPQRVNNSGISYSPTVKAISNLLPSLVNNTRSFFVPTIHSLARIFPSWAVNGQTFFAPTMHGLYILAPSRVGNLSNVFSPFVNHGAIILPSLYINSNISYPPTVVPGKVFLSPGRIGNISAIYAPAVSRLYRLQAQIVNDVDVFFSPAVRSLNILRPSVLMDGDVIFAPSVNRGRVALFPALLTDPDFFYNTTVSIGDKKLFPQRVNNSYVVYLPSVVASVITLRPSLYVVTEAFPRPCLRRGVLLITQVTPTQSQIQASLRNFLRSVLPSNVDVVATQANRVPEPNSPNFVIMTPLRFTRLRTNVSKDEDVSFTASIGADTMIVTDVSFGAIEVGAQVFGVDVAPDTTVVAFGTSTGGVGSYIVSTIQLCPSQKMASGRRKIVHGVEVAIQLDFHSEDVSAASTMALTVSTLMRDEYAVQQFLAQEPNYGVMGLHADNPRQLPFINESQQYEWRWVLEVLLQVDQIVVAPQKYADAIKVIPKSVDALFPPS